MIKPINPTAQKRIQELSVILAMFSDQVATGRKLSDYDRARQQRAIRELAQITNQGGK